MSAVFRSLEKEPLSGKVPPQVAEAVRQLAVRERLSLSASMTLLLCRGLAMDPAGFGLADRRPRRPKAPSA